MDHGLLSLVPPVVALGLAFLTRQILVSLLVGVVAGYLILSNGDPIEAVNDSMTGLIGVLTDPGNIKILLFTLLMGAFVGLVSASGGVAGFVDFLTERQRIVRGKRSAMMLPYLLGIFVFIDGLLSILLAGLIGRPATDRYRVSRAKLAYICDSTSAPINALIPLNAWGAFFLVMIEEQVDSGTIDGDPMGLLLESLPLQFYSLLAVLSVGYYVLVGRDWGPMRKAEAKTADDYVHADTSVVVSRQASRSTREQGQDAALATAEQSIHSGPTDVPAARGSQSKAIYLILPLAVLVGVTFGVLLATGNGDLTEGDGSTAILWGSTASLVAAGLIFVTRRIMSFDDYINYVYRGIGSMVPIVALLATAFAIGDVISELGTGEYLASLVSENLSGALLPAVIFVLGALTAFTTGTSWGTFAVMFPLALPMAAGVEADVPLTIAAVISGGIFGDHCSPMSDTTILTSMASDCEPMEHVRTQLPYAALSAVLAVVLFAGVGILA